nr:reverse transcriptase domain-containing protein [Tanacetum cinerariifolium]
KDVFVKVGKFYFPVDFVVVDYDFDPQVPLILRRPFLRMTRALFDVYGEELTLRVNDKAITFKFGHTSRYSRNYYEESVNQINVIDVACEEYAQEVLRFSDSSTSGNPTPSDPIIATSSPSFTPFKEVTLFWKR